MGLKETSNYKTDSSSKNYEIAKKIIDDNSLSIRDILGMLCVKLSGSYFASPVCKNNKLEIFLQFDDTFYRLDVVKNVDIEKLRRRKSIE